MDIYIFQKIKMKFLNSETKIISEEQLDNYISFCLRHSFKTKIKFKTESHHILPRALFPEFKSFNEFSWNCSNLTYKDHFIAHSILVEAIYDKGQIFAWNSFNTYNQHNLDYSIFLEAEKYSLLKEYHSKEISNTVIVKSLTTLKTFRVSCEEFQLNDDLVHVNFGRKHSDEMKAKISLIHKGSTRSDETKSKISDSKKGIVVAKNLLSGEIVSISKEEFDSNNEFVGHTIGFKHSDETKAKLSEKAKENTKGSNNGMFGKNHSDKTKVKLSEASTGVKHSDETKDKMSKSHLGKKYPIQICPYCGKGGGESGLKRWHFENCRFKRVDLDE